MLANELLALNCWNVGVSGSSAVQYTADTETALRALLWTRMAHKIIDRKQEQEQEKDKEMAIQSKKDLEEEEEEVAT
jgi:23S rRNA G2445 N2-methylase RlmL